LVQVSVVGLVRKVDLAFLIDIVGWWVGDLGAQTGIEQWFGCGVVTKIRVLTQVVLGFLD
jgi:hypothetical protein